MAGRIVSEAEFSCAIKAILLPLRGSVKSVLGPGRSGAVAAVYASHILGVPFLPYGSDVPPDLTPLLIIDTASESGKTLRKTARRYKNSCPVVVAIYQEPPRVSFWYEAQKPQRYAHEANKIFRADHIPACTIARL